MSFFDDNDEEHELQKKQSAAELKKAKIGMYIFGVKIMSVILGTSEFWLIICSNPLPIEAIKKVPGTIPNIVAKK